MSGSLHQHKLVLEWASEWSKHCDVRFVKTANLTESDIRVDFKHGEWSFTN